MDTENYVSLVINDVYDSLTDEIKWPKAIDTPKKKVKFLRMIREYFAKKEEYEKCSKLQKMIDELS